MTKTLVTAARSSGRTRTHKLVEALPQASIATFVNLALATQSNKVEDWCDAFVQVLASEASLTDGSRWIYYNRARQILKEVARAYGQDFRRQNPFKRKAVSTAPLLHGTSLEPLIALARRDALAIANSFRAPDPAHREFIDQARTL